MSERSTWDVASWSAVWASLPEEYHTSKLFNQMHDWYHREIENIKSYVKRLEELDKPFYAYFSVLDVRDMSSQMVANFSVKDLSKPVKDAYNWHLQNTSQWVYAGAMVVDKHAFERDDERIVSTHH